jgi:hypothetical protein
VDERLIQALVCRQIVSALEDDLKGDELLMKEVWEQCATDDDVVAAKHELEEIIDLLRDRDRRHRRALACEVVNDAALFDPGTLRDEFRLSNLVASQRARWCADDPSAPPLTCRYCGKHWRRWTGSKLDGHAACIVTDDFKQKLSEILRSPTVSYQEVADAIGVTPSVVRAWAAPIRERNRDHAR